ncbi:peptidoglycan-binding domain-containing protein [Sorangium sp. So ce406]|uniref:peptidoglycan-binding domain-containing protein n=1 Tax=Sorangium sp. So ce406 TaxID=3133311 RepID=UPI003F5BD814
MRVHPGECISTIAFAHGFFPGTLWAHPNNAALREARKNPNVLAIGDEVFVPDRRPKEVQAATGQRHRFRRRGVPERIRLRFLDAFERPRAGLAYVFEYGAARREGVTDSDGWMQEFVSPREATARVRVGETEVYELRIAHLRSIDEPAGLQQRLANLGYPCLPDVSDVIGGGTRAAIVRFLRDRGRPVPELLDAAAIERLLPDIKAAHGS